MLGLLLSLSADRAAAMLFAAYSIKYSSQLETQLLHDSEQTVLDRPFRGILALAPPRLVQYPRIRHRMWAAGLLRYGQSTDALQGYAASIDQVTSDEPTRAALRELIAWFAQVGKRFRRRTDPPMRHASLLQLREEAQALYEILDNARNRQASLNESERQQILSIHDDMRIEMDQYGQTLGGDAPKAEGWYDVTVNVKGGDPKTLGQIRVYYTFNGLFRPLPAQPPVPSYGFKQTGSGQSDRLLKKNYQIWAAKDGDPNHPLTPPYLLRIDTTSASPLSVDLTMTGSSSP